MRILVLGASGMLGHKILLKLAPHHEVIGTLRKENPALNALLGSKESCLRHGLDAFNIERIKSFIKDFRPDAVINCIGIVKQLEEAKNAYISIAINAMFPHQLEKLSGEFGFRLIHFSTDCVFSGKQGPYKEADACDVSDIYGQTKFLGEVKGEKSLTLRTSIIGREISAPFTGLVEWFLAQKNKGHANGYTNALYTGVTTNEMVNVLAKILKTQELHGLYHLSAESISKYELLKIINDEAVANINVAPYDDFKCDRRLDSSAFRAASGWTPPSWAQMIRTMIDEDRSFYAALGKNDL